MAAAAAAAASGSSNGKKKKDKKESTPSFKNNDDGLAQYNLDAYDDEDDGELPYPQGELLASDISMRGGGGYKRHEIYLFSFFDFPLTRESTFSDVVIGGLAKLTVYPSNKDDPYMINNDEVSALISMKDIFLSLSLSLPPPFLEDNMQMLSFLPYLYFSTCLIYRFLH